MSTKPEFLPIIQQHDYDQLERLKGFIRRNSQREPVKITINYRNKRFSDNEGFAIIKPLGRSSPVMDLLNQKILEAITDIQDWYKDERKIGAPSGVMEVGSGICKTGKNKQSK